MRKVKALNKKLGRLEKEIVEVERDPKPRENERELVDDS